MAYTDIEVHLKGGINTVTLNRPELMNALNTNIIFELIDALRMVELEKEIKVVVLQGAGGNFSSGADRALFMEDHPSPEWLEGMRHFARLVRKLREIPQPVVTKIQGVAMGAGSNLALAGDFVIAAHNMRFRENFIHIGVILDSGGTYFLPRLVGMAKARELAFLGEEIDGRQAVSMGLVYKSVPEEEIDRETALLANTLAQKSLSSLSLIKGGLEESFNKNLKEILEWEAAHQAIMLRTKEHRDIVQFLKTMKK